MLYSVSKQILPSTAVDFAVSGHLVSTQNLNLCVVFGNRLVIYELVCLTESDNENVRLRVVLETVLNGQVASIAVIKANNLSTRDRLLLAFADAKASVVEYDCENDQLRTVSMHYYEQEKYRTLTEDTEYLKPVVRVDPGERCAAMKFYGHHFAIMPIVKENNDQVPVCFDSTFVMSSLSLLDGSVKNIIDFTFLHGFFEPTMAILYEPKQTATARLPLSKDSVALVFVSIAADSKTWSVIYQVNQLPYDLYYLVSVPKPFGGVLVFGTNSIIHFDQGNRGFGIALNAYSFSSSNYHLTDLSSLVVHLDGVHSCPLSDTSFLVSNFKAEYFRVSLSKNIRQNTSIDLQRLNLGGVLTAHVSCFSTIGSRFIFCGSSDGDSYLCLTASQSKSVNVDRTANKRIKKSHYEKANNEDLDELDIILDNVPDQTRTISESVEVLESGNSSFRLSICDSITCLGSLSDILIVDAAYSYDQYANTPFNGNVVTDIIGVRGSRHQCSLLSAHQSIRPFIRNTFELPDTTVNSWTLICNPKGVDDIYHRFLLVTKESKFKKGKSNLYTMVFTAGVHLDELKNSEFHTSGATIYAASVMGNNFVVQVFAEGMRLLDYEGKKRHEMLLRDIDMLAKEGTVWIVGADSSLDQIVLHLNDGRLLLLRADEQLERLHVQETPEEFRSSCFSHFSLFRDEIGIFDADEMILDNTKTSKKRNISRVDDNNDDDLYLQQNPSFTSNDSSQAYRVADKPSASQLYCAVVTFKQQFKILSIPSMKVIFFNTGFATLPKLLINSEMQTNEPIAAVQEQDQLTDLKMFCSGSARLSKLYLLAVSKIGLVTLYQAFSYGEHRFRFKKCNHSHLIQPEVIKTDNEDVENIHSLDKRPKKRVIFAFDNIKGLISTFDSTPIRGVFVAGSNPCFLFLNQSCELRVHPMYIDGNVISWSPFHNVNCSLGFVYFNASQKLRIAQLDRRFDYQYHIPLNLSNVNTSISQYEEEMIGTLSKPHNDIDEYEKETTVWKLQYHAETKKICAISFREGQFSGIRVADPVTASNQDEDEESTEKPEQDIDQPYQVGEGKYLPTSRLFTVDLYSPRTWELVDRVVFPIYEDVVCIKCVLLDRKSGGNLLRKPHLVIGTANVKGEDTPCRGSVYLYEVIEVVPRPGRPETNHKFKLIKKEEMKGPVASISDLEGYLCLAIGSKIMMYSFEDGESLVGVAFLDTCLYINCMYSIKSFLIMGDINRGIWLTGFQEEPLYRLNVLGKDYGKCSVMDVNIVVQEESLVITLSDVDGNIQLFSYNPSNIASFGGEKLLRVGDYFTGAPVIRFCRAPCRKILTGSDSTTTREHCLLYACNNGCISILVPIEEKTFKRLFDISLELTYQTPSVAGLNQRDYRNLKTKEQFGSHPMKNIVDSDFVIRFKDEAMNECARWSRNRGTSVEKVLEDLLRISLKTALF